MSFDAYTPITSSSRLQVPRGHRLYNTSRQIATETPIPDIGDTMESQVGGGTKYAENIIFDVSDSPTQDGKKSLTLRHTALPSLPWTTYTQLDVPKNHKVYTTVILIPISYDIPELGETISEYDYLSDVPAALQSNLITNVNYPNAYGGYRLEIQHTALPDGTHVVWESIAHNFPAIYPNETTFFPNGSLNRPRVVVARVEWEFCADPTVGDPSWQNDAVIWDWIDVTTGPLEVESLILEASTQTFIDGDGDSGQVGEYLNQTFINQTTIHPAISISAPGDLAYSIEASIPSIATYADWVTNGTEFMLRRTISNWLGTLYARRTVWIKAQ